MSHSKLRCAMLGVGGRGAYLTSLLTERDDFEPAVLMDVNPEFMAEARASTGLPETACFTTAEAALDTPGLDACVITTPARFHTALMQAAIERGLHIFVAKPMTYDLNEAATVVAAAHERNVRIMVDQQQQFLMSERTVAGWLRAKKWGEVGFGSFTIHRHRPDMRAFTGSAPFLWEQGVHSFNSLLAMLDRPAIAVQAHQMQPVWSNYNGPTVCQGVIEFAGHVPIQYLGTFDSNVGEQDIRFECERGAVRLRTLGWQKEVFAAPTGGAFEPCGISDADDTRAAEHFNLDNWRLAIETGAAVPNDGRDNLRTLAICDAFLRSAQSGNRELVRQF